MTHDVLALEDRRVWAVAVYAGLRRGEIIGLRPEDIDLPTGVIHVRRGWDMLDGEVEPKSRKGKRKVPIPAILRGHLDAIDGPLGEPNWIARTNVRSARIWASADLPTITLHEARHTYASLMIAAGVNAKALSTFMGHANIGITLDLYGDMFPGAEDEAAGLLDALPSARCCRADCRADRRIPAMTRFRSDVSHLIRRFAGLSPARETWSRWSVNAAIGKALSDGLHRGEMWRLEQMPNN